MKGIIYFGAIAVIFALALEDVFATKSGDEFQSNRLVLAGDAAPIDQKIMDTDIKRSGMNEMNKSMSMMRTEMEACKDISSTNICKKLKKKKKCDSEEAQKNCKKTCDHCDDEEEQEGDVRLEDGKFPEVFLNEIWSPICGHFFWDNNVGASLFCQKLTSDSASFGYVTNNNYLGYKPLEKDAIRIGKCLSNDQWLSCSGGCNDLGIGQGCADCDANSPAAMEIECHIGGTNDWCARLYGAEGWCCGWEKYINETNQLDLTGYLDNSLSSWRVYPGCTLTLFNEHNNVGLLASSTVDVRGIGLSGYNDKVSSLSCTCQGTTTTPTTTTATTTTTTTTTTSHHFCENNGNGICDDINNVIECNYDDGDCTTTTTTTTTAGCEDNWPTKKCNKKCNAKKCLKSKSCKKNCRNTCDLCGIEEPCEDQKSSKFCNKALTKGKCGKSSIWKKCKKTCDKC